MNHVRLWSAVLLAAVSLGGSGGSLAGTGQPPVFDVPKLDKIVIDGKADDWGARGFRVEVLTVGEGDARPPANSDGRFRLGWDDRGLLLLVAVTDDVPFEAADAGSLWQGDSVEAFYADKLGGAQKVQCIVAPGTDPRFAELRLSIHDQRSGPPKAQGEPVVTAARTKTKNGYVLEMLLPWSNLGVQPAPGREVAFQLYLNDTDAGGPRYQLRWFPEADTHADSTHMHRIRLSDKAGDPVLAAASGRYDGLRWIRADVRAAAELAGKPVAVAAGGKTLARGALGETDGRALAALRVPMPPPGKPYGPLDVLMDGKRVATLDLPDADKHRARRFMEADLAFRPCLLAGPRFPDCEFAQPLTAELMIGPYKIETSFYDRDYNAVKQADRPGRYGAVVRIRSEDGRTFTRFRTLYRQARPLAWWDYDAKVSMELPKELGIDPAVAAEQDRSVAGVLKWALVTFAERSSAPAVLLAGLSEMKPGQGPATVYNDPEALDRQWWVGLKRKLNGNDKRYAQPVVCPRPIGPKAAPVLRKGTLAEAGMKPDAAKKIDAVLTEWSADTDEAFIACVARHGVIVLHKAYGRRDGKDMTTADKSWMASLTKLLQGTCMMMLVDRGLVDLDSPVEEYLPELGGVKVATPMTVRHLFTHTADMWGHWGDDVNDLEHLVAEYYAYLEIGKRHQYNGMSLSLGSKIIEQVSGESLPAFYSKHLLAPLGCANTDATTSSHDARSTAMDMAKVGQMLVNGGAYGDMRFFSEATLQKMLPVRLTMLLGPKTPITWGIGCVWMSTDVFGERTFGHGSAASATLRIDLDNDLVVSMTRNRAGRNFQKYHARFLQAVADGMIDAKARAAKP